MMNRRSLASLFAGLAVALATVAAPAVHAADEAPDALVKRLSSDVLDSIKADKTIQAGDVSKIVTLVDS